jgi:DeoR/GlpR family transcriptional regulator of sugar metabolism
MLEHIRRIGRVGVSELAERLQISVETVRRDLKVLDDHGLVSRTHGGAFPTDGARYETSLGLRAGLRVPDKRRIAGAAIQHLGSAQTIFVDEGFTPQLVAKGLTALNRPLTVITPSLGAATILATAEHSTVIQLGGRVREQTRGTVDHWAIDMLSSMVIDLAILGTNGICLQRGLTTPEPAVQALKQRVVQVSARRLLVGISAKFGVTSFCRFADIADCEKIITDNKLTAYEAQRFSELGPEVIRV